MQKDYLEFLNKISTERPVDSEKSCHINRIHYLKAPFRWDEKCHTAAFFEKTGNFGDFRSKNDYGTNTIFPNCFLSAIF